MTNAQKPNKHRRTKSNKATGTKGSVRGKKNLKHGKGKSMIKSDIKKKRR